MSNNDDPIEKLRMAPSVSPEELARQFETEQRALNFQREVRLEDALAPFRVGSVGYLNAVPLTRGLENEVIYATPARLAEMLRADELDAALVSVTEVVSTDRYDVLDGIAIASMGEVKSVLLAHRCPLDQIREIHCDPASLTSVQMLKVLLGERGLKPGFKPLASYEDAGDCEAVLLIGDPAIDFSRCSHEHQLWDLGTAWQELTQLPFVYAVWALRKGVENPELRRRLREARDFGLETLDSIIRSRSEYDLDFRKDYLGWHIHYYMGPDERKGLARFMELLERHGLGPVHNPTFVH